MHKNLTELLEEKTIDITKTYRVYEAGSDIPLFYNHEAKWYENLNDGNNKIVVAENFHKLYLIPNVTLIDEEPEEEPTINFSLGLINKKGLWETFCDWKGWDYYASAERISDWNEKVMIPLSKAKSWGLI